MKRIYRDIDPNYEAPAKLYRDNTFIAEVPCQIWFPRHDYERPFLRFDSTDKAHQSIASISPVYDVFIELVSLNGRKTNVYARRMFIDNFKTFHRSTILPPLITFEGEPQIVTETVNIGSRDDSHGKTHVVMHLMDNSLLSPSKIMETNFRGEVTVKDVRIHKDSIEPVGEITFDKYFYFIQMRDGGEASYEKLVAVFGTDLQIKDLEEFEKTIKPAVHDYLLLASFAANQRTNVVAWSSFDGESQLKAWYGNVPVESPDKQKRHSYDDVLIDIVHFQEFMRTANGTFSRLSTPEKQLIRQAIYWILPKQRRTVESSVLNFFAAIESVVLIHRRNTDLELTISIKKDWEKLEKNLRIVIKENYSLFSTPEHMQMLINMLPSLKRVPLKEAFLHFVTENKVDLSDLWPVFGPPYGATLSEIRNTIIHGDSFNKESFTPLCHAMNNIECIAKRLILTTLEWDVEKSNISKTILRANGWLSNANLTEDMRTLSTP